MDNRNIQMKNRKNNQWENLFPLTLNENVYDEQGTNLKTQLSQLEEDLEKQVQKLSVMVPLSNGTDDTDMIQSLLDQSREIVFPVGTYHINKEGLYLNSGNKITMQDNTVLKMIPNDLPEFQMLLIEDVHNVAISGGILHGDRTDHTGSTGEWGHLIRIMGATNVVIDGTVTRNGWGDGIYINGVEGGLKYAKDITIKNVVSTNNRRQGMSVISVDGLYVENTEFSHTNGTAPESGVDFEPNDDTYRMKNIVFEQVTFKDNVGGGLVTAFNKTTTSKTIDLTLKNCVFDGDFIGMSSGGQHSADHQGKISFISPQFKNFKTTPIIVNAWHKNMPPIVFDDPLFTINEKFTGTSGDTAALILIRRLQTTQHVKDVGNVILKNLICRKTTSATTSPQFIMFGLDTSGGNPAPLKDVRIIDPIDVSGLQENKAVVRMRKPLGGGNLFTDRLGVCDTTVTGGSYDLLGQLATLLELPKNTPANVNVYAPDFPIQQSLTIRNLDIPGRFFRFNSQDDASFEDDSKVLSVYGGETITIKRISNEQYVVTNKIIPDTGG